MPVDTLHHEYTKNVEKWQKCRDAVEGEEAVKAAGDKYLPMLSDQDPSAYKAYKQRASFFGATGRTVIGLTGAIMRKSPKIEFPESKKDLLDNLGVRGESLVQLCTESVSELLSTGRVGVFVDAPQAPDALPYVTLYYPENIVNWKTDASSGREVVTMVVLKEEAHEYSVDDVFKPICIDQRRVLKLDSSGDYVQQVWRKKEKNNQGKNQDEWVQKGTDIKPVVKGGKTLKEIPFFFINVSGISASIEKSPIIDLVNVNLSHYRTSADLEHGRHFTALPTAWVAGFDTKTTKLAIGSSIAWVSENPDAHAGFLEFTGAGLNSLSEALKEKEAMMAVLGSRLLEESKAGVEAAETLKLRQSGESSVLSHISNAVSEGMTDVLQVVARWIGIDEEDISVRLNTDFLQFTIDSAILEKLMAAVQAGLISYNTWFFNLKAGEIIPDDVTMEQEKEFIKVGNPESAQAALMQAQIDAQNADAAKKTAEADATGAAAASSAA